MAVSAVQSTTYDAQGRVTRLTSPEGIIGYEYDIKMTMRYVHIGFDDQTKAVVNLPAAALHFGRL